MHELMDITDLGIPKSDLWCSKEPRALCYGVIDVLLRSIAY